MIRLIRHQGPVSHPVLDPPEDEDLDRALTMPIPEEYEDDEEWTDP